MYETFGAVVGSLLAGLAMGGGYGVIGSLVALLISTSLYENPNDMPKRQVYAITLLWVIALPVYVATCVPVLFREIYPLLRGPSKHERALAEIARLEAIEDKARNDREPSLARWERESGL